MPDRHFKPVMGWHLASEGSMDGAREQRAGQGGVDPRLTALDEGALFNGSPWNTHLEVATASAGGTLRGFDLG
jgi:hypothetical protein